MRKRLRSKSPLLLEIGVMEGGEDFEITELTVNPYLTGKKSGVIKTEIWIEVLCKRKSETKIGTLLPSFHVNFKDIENHNIRPITNYPQKNANFNFDLNRILYAEMWASMVFSQDGRPDFMQKGIDGGKRLIGKNVDFTKLIEEFSVAYDASHDKEFKDLLSELIRKFGLLNDCFQRLELSKNDEITLPEGLVHPGSQLKFDPNIGAGTLAFSRKRWLEENEERLDVVYPCEVSSHPLHNGWKLTPKPIAPESSPISSLKKEDALSFWFYFDSEAGVQEDVVKELRKFNFEIYPTSDLVQMNTFLRVPKKHSIEVSAIPDFSALTRSLELFKVWDAHVDNRTYATRFKEGRENKLIKKNKPIQIDVDLVDEGLAQGKLMRIFIFGFIISACVAYEVNLLTSVMTDNELSYASELSISNLPFPVPIWIYAGCAAVAAIVFVITALLDYNFIPQKFPFIPQKKPSFKRRRTYRKMGLILGALFTFVPILVPFGIFLVEKIITALFYVFT